MFSICLYNWKHGVASDFVVSYRVINTAFSAYHLSIIIYNIYYVANFVVLCKKPVFQGGTYYNNKQTYKS